MTEQKVIKIGSIVETTMIAGRFGKVIAESEFSSPTFIGMRYEVEFGRMDFVNNFKAWKPDLVATVTVFSDQIVRVL